MIHPKFPAIHKAMQNLIPTMHQRARQNGNDHYQPALAHEWVSYLLDEWE